MARKKNTGFAEKLRELRTAKGFSQAALAELAGMHLHGITKLEQGEREPSWATVQALAAALEVSCEAFAADADSAAEDVKRPRGRPTKPMDAVENKSAKKAKKK